MTREDFLDGALQFWTTAIENVAGDNSPVSTTWRGVDYSSAQTASESVQKVIAGQDGVT